MADNKKTCIDCGILHCRLMEHEFPEFCPTLEMTDEFIDSAMELYEDPLNSKITIAAAEVEAEFYCQITRIEEIMVFAQKIGAKKLGIATCIGLMKEARTAAKIFRHNGFEVVGLSCKAGVQKKVDVGIDPKCNALGENMCNPILQARLLNQAHTIFGVLVEVLVIKHKVTNLCLFDFCHNSLIFNLFAKVVKKNKYPQLSAVFCKIFSNFVAESTNKKLKVMTPIACESSGFFISAVLSASNLADDKLYQKQIKCR